MSSKIKSFVAISAILLTAPLSFCANAVSENASPQIRMGKHDTLEACAKNIIDAEMRTAVSSNSERFDSVRDVVVIRHGGLIRDIFSRTGTYFSFEGTDAQGRKVSGFVAPALELRRELIPGTERLDKYRVCKLARLCNYADAFSIAREGDSSPVTLPADRSSCPPEPMPDR
jgi:hypothetical protein